MKDDFQFTLRSDDPDDINVHFPQEGTTMSLPVTDLGDDMVRIEAMPFAIEGVNFRDVIKVKKRADGSLEFVCVVEPSNWCTYTMFLSREEAEGPEIQRFCARLWDLGCYWERVFVGCLLIGVPPDLDMSLDDILKEPRDSTQ